MSKQKISTEYKHTLEMFIKHLQKEQTPHKSVTQKTSAIQRFLRSIEKSYDSSLKLSEIMRIHVKKYQSVLEQEYTPSYVNTQLSFVKSFFTYLELEGLNHNKVFTEWNYRVKNNVDTRTLSSSELNQIEDYINNNYSSANRGVLLYKLALYSGAKKNELCNLHYFKNSNDFLVYNTHTTVTNYILENERSITLGNQKKTRSIPLSDPIMRMILDYRAALSNLPDYGNQDIPYLFPSNYDLPKGEYTAIEESSLNEDLKQMFNNCPNINSKGLAFQVIRDTMIKGLLIQNTPVETILTITNSTPASLNKLIQQLEHKSNYLNELFEHNHPLSKWI